MRSSRAPIDVVEEQPVLDPAVGGDEHGDQLAVAQRHELDPLEPLLIRIGREDHRRVVREIARAGATRAGRPRRASARSRARGSRPSRAASGRGP